MAIRTGNLLADDHAGARWLVPTLAVLAAVVLFAILMLGYPYL